MASRINNANFPGKSINCRSNAERRIRRKLSLMVVFRLTLVSQFAFASCEVRNWRRMSTSISLLYFVTPKSKQGLFHYRQACFSRSFTQRARIRFSWEAEPTKTASLEQSEIDKSGLKKSHSNNFFRVDRSLSSVFIAAFVRSFVRSLLFRTTTNVTELLKWDKSAAG